MHTTLLFPRKLAATLTLCSLVFSFSMLFPAQALANHGAEGSTGGGVFGGTSAASLLGAAVDKAPSDIGLSDSLWGNLLLMMAYQRDPELRTLARKLKRVNTLTMLSIAGISGLGLAQSIYSLNIIEPQHLDVMGHDDHGTVTIPSESRTPSTLGIIGSGMTLATLGAKAVMNKRYAKKLSERQRNIRQKIEQILAYLESGGNTNQVQAELASFVGERCTREFLQLWTVTHPSPAMP